MGHSERQKMGHACGGSRCEAPRPWLSGCRVASRILDHMSSDEHETENAADGLLPTLEVIEQQPLGQRAVAYAALLDELSRRLDSSPSQA